MTWVLSRRHMHALLFLFLMMMLSVSFVFVMRHTPFSNPSLMVSRIVDGFIVLSRRSGLSLERVELKGNDYLSNDHILSLARLYPSKPILLADPSMIAENFLDSGGWISDFVIERGFPSSISIEVIEKVPVVFWEGNGRFLTEEGKELFLQADRAHSRSIRDRLSLLPLVVGEGENLPDKWRILRLEMNEFTDILARVSVFRWIDGRRWNLVLRSGELIKLPEGDVRDSLLLMDKMQARHRLLERGLFGIDLRFRSRMIIRKRGTLDSMDGTTVMLEGGRV